MGREIKRVSTDFSWPLDVVWGGAINPYWTQRTDCPDCGGSGSSPEARHLKDQWYGNAPFSPESRGSKPFAPDHPVIRLRAERNAESMGMPSREPAIVAEAKRLCGLFNAQWSHHLNADDVNALVESNRLMDLTHTFTPGEGWKKKEPAYTPTPEEVNEWSLSSFGHDGINQWSVVSAECKRLGVSEVCERCDGDSDIWPSEEIRQAYKSWEPTPPPAGEGWQVWETVSEGSPITPVLDTAERLVDYLVENGDLWDQKRGDGGWERDAAESFVQAAWAPSMVGVAGKFLAPRDGQTLPTEGSDG